MGKKSGRGKSNDAAKASAATEFVLKLPTHCRCDGCGDKIRAAVKDLTLRCDGILALDTSALATKGELALVATADPERLRRRLRKATGKSVDLVFPKKPQDAPAKDAAAAAAVQALLANLQLQQPVQAYQGYGHPAAYPWVVHQQAPPPEPYYASYPVAAYPAAAASSSWAAYPPHDGLGGGAYGWTGGY